MHISEMQLKIDKKLAFFETKLFEVFLRKSAYCEGNTCPRESTC